MISPSLCDWERMIRASAHGVDRFRRLDLPSESQGRRTQRTCSQEGGLGPRRRGVVRHSLWHPAYSLCSLWHPVRGRVKLDVSSGCPRIDEKLAWKFIDEIQNLVKNVGAAIRTIQARIDNTLPLRRATRNLTKAILIGTRMFPANWGSLFCHYGRRPRIAFFRLGRVGPP